MTTPVFDSLDSLRLTFDTSVQRTTRTQRIQFGDGYTQLIKDGLNDELETWSCTTPAMSGEETWGLEAFLQRNKGQALSWTPPDATKQFRVQFTSGTLRLGYTQIANLALGTYTRPTNYTANLVTGLLTSVTIPNAFDVLATLTLSPRNYLLQDAWNIAFIAPDIYKVSFNLTRVYV
jgi:phage-related protein